MKVKRLKFIVIALKFGEIHPCLFYLQLRDFVDIKQNIADGSLCITYLHAGEKEQITINLTLKQNELNAKYLYDIKAKNLHK